MWTCLKCDRNFKTNNQPHSCTTVAIDALFEGKNPELVLVFEPLRSEISSWELTTVGASKKPIIFTNNKAWLIV